MTPEKAAHLLPVMALWWSGKTAWQIAEQLGIAHWQVRSLLAWVGCTPELRHAAADSRTDSTRRARANLTVEASVALAHPLAHKLTVRQRAALAWKSQGLGLFDIARRMNCTSQAVHQLLVAGRQRLERLTWIEACRRPRPVEHDGIRIDSSDIEEMMSRSTDEPGEE